MNACVSPLIHRATTCYTVILARNLLYREDACGYLCRIICTSKTHTDQSEVERCHRGPALDDITFSSNVSPLQFRPGTRKKQAYPGCGGFGDLSWSRSMRSALQNVPVLRLLVRMAISYHGFTSTDVFEFRTRRDSGVCL